MPVEIRELEINVQVGQGQGAGPLGGGAADRGSQGGDKDELIRTCIEEVMEIIKNKKER